MRLATVERDGGTVAVVLLEGEFAVIDDGKHRDVGELLRAGGAAERAREAVRHGTRGRLDGVHLRRPILTPGVTICVGMNYRSHAEELGRSVGDAPTLFDKVPRALADPDADIELPDMSAEVDYEAELAVVIGDGGYDIAAADAWSAIAGATLINDVSMRDVQRRSRQVFAGKNFEWSTPVGPAMLLLDGGDGYEALSFELRVNGQLRQRGRADDLIFDVPALVHDVSRIMTLHPGDLIATGTPSGVGMHMHPPEYLGDGDVVELEAPGIGVLRNRFVARAARRK